MSEAPVIDRLVWLYYLAKGTGLSFLNLNSGYYAYILRSLLLFANVKSYLSNASFIDFNYSGNTKLSSSILVLN